MEECLLTGESSNRRRLRRFSFDRRDAIAYGSAYQKAAALADLAEDGVGLPEEILEGSSFEKAAALYFVFIIRLSLNYLALVVLNFLEKPLWCSKHLAESCNNRDYYYLGELPYLSGAESLIYEDKIRERRRNVGFLQSCEHQKLNYFGGEEKLQCTFPTNYVYVLRIVACCVRRWYKFHRAYNNIVAVPLHS